MKIVIEIPDDEYQRWTTEGEMDAFIARDAMVNGKPLSEVIEAIKEKAEIYCSYCGRWADKDEQNLTLEQEPILDKIRAEIEQVVEEESKFDKKWAQGLKYALKIIDKHWEP